MSSPSLRRRTARALALPVMIAVIAVGSAGGAGAATEYVGGGTWYHGFSGNSIYSTDDHNGREHRASVTTTAQDVDSGWKRPGVRATASAQQSVTRNKANDDYR